MISKEPLSRPTPLPSSVRASRPKALRVIILTVLCVFGWHVFTHERYSPWRLGARPAAEQKEFSWKDLKPSKSLDFVDCGGGLECTRLDVPLDWTQKHQDGGKRAAIAVARVPAKVPITDPRYGGAVLVNPGGPGGSGVSLTRLAGTLIQPIIDSTENPAESTLFNGHEKYYDVIGFDPRGVMFSTPSTSCFPDEVSLNTWDQEARAQGFPHSNETFAASWSRHVSLAQSCTWRMGDEENEGQGIGRYLSTPSVVEDMVAIIEALGEWREAKYLKSEDNHRSLRPTTRIVPDQVRWKKGEEKLLYWGFSYGTILGATFAAMHPDKVERVILDGVVEAEDYYSGQWLENLQDAESIVESLLSQCYEAGPLKCDLYRPTLQEVKDVFFDTLARLKEDPLPVPAHGKFGPEIIVHDDLSWDIVQTLYSPLGFPIVAKLINELSQGNGTLLAEFKRLLVPSSCLSPYCIDHPWRQDCFSNLGRANKDMQSAILCSDGEDITDWTRDDHYRRWKILESQSPTFAPFWSQISMPCSNWGLRPAWNFNQSISAQNTSYPILFLSNTRDPVTPLRNAEKMSTKFPGSVVFGQDADGHCTISAPSVCVAKAIRGYFHEGKLPQGGMACKPDGGIFDSWEQREQGLEAADIHLSKKMREFSDLYQKRAHPLGL